jgi:hypothetical protein
MDGLLGQFIRKQQAMAVQPEAPNKVKGMKGTPAEKFVGTYTLASLIEDKPSSKKVLEFIKNRINEIITEE